MESKIIDQLNSNDKKVLCSFDDNKANITQIAKAAKLPEEEVSKSLKKLLKLGLIKQDIISKNGQIQTKTFIKTKIIEYFCYENEKNQTTQKTSKRRA